MSQESIFNFLKEHKGKWFTRNKISKLVTSIGKGSISCNLTKLRMGNMVYFRLDSFGDYEYCYKR